jgi:hypothetical protein
MFKYKIEFVSPNTTTFDNLVTELSFSKFYNSFGLYPILINNLSKLLSG